jgi:hypothetical protein
MSFFRRQTLKDLSRYEETYYRKGVVLVFKVMPITFRSKEDINRW